MLGNIGFFFREERAVGKCWSTMIFRNLQMWNICRGVGSIVIGDPEVRAPRGCEVPRLQHMLRSADSSIKEESCWLADISWLMSYGGNRVSALPSIMEFCGWSLAEPLNQLNHWTLDLTDTLRSCRAVCPCKDITTFTLANPKSDPMPSLSVTWMTKSHHHGWKQAFK